MIPDVLLLPAPAADDGPSMSRYARELHAALVQLPGRARVITLEAPLGTRLASRFVDHPQTRRFDNILFRYVGYPRSLRRRRAGAFHILDHAYAHLIRALDPERTIVTCHDLIPLLAADGKLPVHVPAATVRAFRWRVDHLARARVVLADSDATRATLARYTQVRPERITVIPLGVSPTFRVLPDDAGKTRASAGASDASALLLQVATWGRYKNTPVLLHALAALRASLGASVRLVRIGSPLHPDEHELAMKLGVLDAIHSVGMVRDDETLVKWYNAADVFVFPSLWEGFGMPPLEAMACGTPVVASDAPAVVEVVGDAGIVTPAADPSALARAIERVLADRGLAETLREKGLLRARQFSWTSIAERTRDVYDTVRSS